MKTLLLAASLRKIVTFHAATFHGWMMPALKWRPLEIFVPFHVLIGRAKECFDIQTLIADAYKFDDLNGVR
jgi:hypothetical protein